jgi:hypothetical protein
MWTCPKCYTQNMSDVVLCHKCKSDPSGQLRLDQCLLWNRPAGCAFYSFILGPGEIRYLEPDYFAAIQVEEWIGFFKQQSKTPEIEGPWGGNPDGLDRVETEALFGDTTWEDKIRIHHGFAVLHRDFGVPSVIYSSFHSTLVLRAFEIVECVDSWIREAWKDPFVIQTFLGSSQHLVLECGKKSDDPAESRLAVFKKTPFVIKRLEAVQKLEEETKSVENLERLRKTGFTTFVYIMEDLRNGIFKIGQSQTPEKRENTLQSEVPEISLRFYIPAHDTAENELHELFAAKRVRGEWFEFAPEDLLSVIDFLKRHGDLPRASVDYEWLGKISFGAFSSRQGQPEISGCGDKDVAQVVGKAKLEMPK